MGRISLKDIDTLALRYLTIGSIVGVFPKYLPRYQARVDSIKFTINGEGYHCDRLKFSKIIEEKYNLTSEPLNVTIHSLHFSYSAFHYWRSTYIQRFEDLSFVLTE